MGHEYLILHSLSSLLGAQGSNSLFFISSVSLSYLVINIEKLTWNPSQKKDLPQFPEKRLILKKVCGYRIETHANFQL